MAGKENLKSKKRIFIITRNHIFMKKYSTRKQKSWTETNITSPSSISVTIETIGIKEIKNYIDLK